MYIRTQHVVNTTRDFLWDTVKLYRTSMTWHVRPGFTNPVAAVHCSLVFALFVDAWDSGYGCGAWAWLCLRNLPVCRPGDEKGDLRKHEAFNYINLQTLSRLIQDYLCNFFASWITYHSLQYAEMNTQAFSQSMFLIHQTRVAIVGINYMCLYC